MLSTASATEFAFLTIAVIQAVFAAIWATGAWWARTARRAIAHWAIWSGLGAITWLILATSFDSPPLLGILVGVLGALALHRGIRLFIGRAPMHRAYLVSLVVIVSISWLGQERRYIEAAVNFGVLALVYCGIAHDLYLHGRDRLRFRWPLVLALPVLLGSLAYGSRSLQALARPESVLTEMAANSTLNLGGALTYIVLAITLHATLMALVVGRLIDELRKLSLYDALTGLLNRRAMEETLHAQLRSARRSGRTFVLMMLDLDYFKRINDQFGHAVGDLALQHVSNLLRTALRDIDILARFGGEEFVVLMPDTPLAAAEPVAERLRALLTANPLQSESRTVTLSVSIGVAEWRGPEDEAAQLMSRADAALFQAKVQGRNRVVTAVARELAPA